MMTKGEFQIAEGGQAFHPDHGHPDHGHPDHGHPDNGRPDNGRPSPVSPIPAQKTVARRPVPNRPGWALLITDGPVSRSPSVMKSRAGLRLITVRPPAGGAGGEDPDGGAMSAVGRAGRAWARRWERRCRDTQITVALAFSGVLCLLVGLGFSFGGLTGSALLRGVLIHIG